MTATICLGALLVLLLLVLDRYGTRLRRLERESALKKELKEAYDRETAMMIRIAFLEKEVKAIQGSVPFQIFSHAKTA